MEITPFHNYSDALLPLPPMPLDGPAPAQSVTSSTGPSFQDILAGRLDSEISTELGPDLSPASGIQGSEMLDVFSLHGIGLQDETTAQEDKYGGLMEACRDIEGYLLSLLLNNLGDSISESGLFSQTYESSFYKDMFFYEIAREIGNQPPGLGIADVLYSDIIMKLGETTALVE